MGATTIPEQTATDTDARPPLSALAPGTRGYKILLIAIVVMGIMLVVGVIALGVMMAGRMSGGRTPARVESSAPVTAGEPFVRALDEPAGSQIAGIATAGERLAVHVTGGGAARVLLVDPQDGRVVGRIVLAR